MQWIAALKDEFSQPAGTAATAASKLGTGLRMAANDASGLDAANAKNAATTREMYGELAAAEAELRRLQAAQKKLEPTNIDDALSADTKAWQKLTEQVDQAKRRVQQANAALVSRGAAGFDVRKYDADQKAQTTALKKAQTERDKELQAGTKRLGENAAKVGKFAAGVVTAAAAAGAVALVGLAALGQRTLAAQATAQARLNAVQQRFNVGLNVILRKANLTPSLTALDRMSAMFDANTATGKFMGEQIKRAFDLAGRGVTALVPLAERGFAKMLIYTIRAETGLYKLVTAGARIGSVMFRALSSSPESLDAIRDGAHAASVAINEARGAVVAVAGALQSLGNSGTAAAIMLSIIRGQARFVALTFGMVAGIVGGVATAIGGAAKIIKGIFTGDMSTAIEGFQGLMRGGVGAMTSFIFGQVKLMASAVDVVTAGALGLTSKVGALEKSYRSTVDKGIDAMKPAAKGADGVGQDIGKGIVTGLDAQTSAISEAGKRAADAAIKGAKTGAEIKSPSGKARRQVGRELGRGVVVGMEGEKRAIDQAAQKNLVPSMNGLGGTEGQGAAAATSSAATMTRAGIHIDLSHSNFYGTQTQEDIDRMFRVAAMRHYDQMLDELGGMT